MLDALFDALRQHLVAVVKSRNNCEVVVTALRLSL